MVPSAVRTRYIAFDAVSFAYREKQTAVLTDFTLELKRREFFLLLGPSGCGKTTALNMLAGFEHPLEGHVSVDGQPITGPGPDRVVVFQGDDSLLGWLSTAENVEFGLLLAGVSRAERKQRAGQVLETVGLAGHGAKHPAELSGGMKQRVQIARALVSNADILLMDEPFAAVDAQTRTILQDELARIWTETRRTVLFITHDIAEAIILGDRIGIMRAGPDSNIKEIVTNDLPRPRSRGDASFATMYARIERAVSEEVMSAMRKESR
ncbi:MAG TPA: ABC transporter ATP-binding protein [bacterium]|nr:ABC transporter ATP-binding protein [bacterium]